jgi:CBS domain-containing protein
MPSNTEPFLQAFSRMEKSLRALTDSSREDSFYSMVSAAIRTNAVVRRHANDLREIADLRNAIVHERFDGHPIAEPYDTTVTWASELADQLENPPRLLSALGGTVATCGPDDPVGEAAHQMFAGDFSQLPVYREGQFVALLTAETITRWLGAKLKDGIGLVEEVAVETVLPYAEDQDNVQFLSHAATAYEALELFDKYERSGRTLDAILVTQDARRDVKALAIATIYEVPKLLNLTRAQ